MLGSDDDNVLAELKKQVQRVVASFQAATPAADSRIIGASQNHHPLCQSTYEYQGKEF